MRATNLKRFGVESPSQLPEVQKKIKATNLKRYGTEYGMQNKDVLAKMRETHVRKYGGIGNQSPIIREKIQKTCLERYGVVSTLLTDRAKKQANSPEAIQKNSRQ